MINPNLQNKDSSLNHYEQNNINNILNKNAEKSTLLPSTINTNYSKESQIIYEKANSFSPENITKTREIMKDIYLRLLSNFNNKDISKHIINNKIICPPIIDKIETKINACNNDRNTLNNKLTKKDVQVKIEGQNIEKYVQNKLGLDDKSFRKAFNIAATQILKDKLNSELKNKNNAFDFEIKLNNDTKLFKSNVKHLIDTNPSILKEYMKVLDNTPTIIKFFIKFIKFIKLTWLLKLINLEALLEINHQFIMSINDHINKNDIINIDDPINLYQHTIEINDNVPGDQKSIIRNGHIHNLEAAKKYLNEMLKLQTTKFKDKDGYQIIIDNRLMYDTHFRESTLISNHIKFINKAIEDYNTNNPDNQLRILNFNLQPQYLFGIHSKNTKKFIEFNNLITNSDSHKSLIESDYRYKFIYKMLQDIINNNFLSTGGEKAYNLGFILQYIATSNNIAFSEGCKSNKYRGSMKKLNDEWFYAKLNLLGEEELEKLNFEEFFKLDTTNHEIYKEIYHNNISTMITMLNTMFGRKL